MGRIAEILKPHITFKKLIKYCDVTGFNIKDILNMSDFEVKLWYEKALKDIENEKDFQIRTGWSLDTSRCKL